MDRPFLAAGLSSLALLVGACSGDASNDTGNPGPAPGPSPSPAACLTPDAILARIEATGYQWIPTEADLACQAPIPRLPFPEEPHVYLAAADDFPGVRPDLISAHVGRWDEIAATRPVNVSSALMGVLPPYADERGRDLTYPMPEPYLSQKLRVAGVAFLRAKARGLPVVLTNFYPPGTAAPPFATAADALAYWRAVILPEKEREAVFAESLGLEAYMPFPNEPERVVASFVGGVEALPVEEKVALTQAIVDETYARVRPLFSGVLQVVSYAKYEPTEPGGPADGLAWKAMDYGRFDAVSFAIFPQCSLEDTRRYVRTQLGHAADMVRRDGIRRWTVGEISVRRERFTPCGMGDETYRATEPDLYRAIFEEVDALGAGRPGASIAASFVENPATHAVIAERWSR